MNCLICGQETSGSKGAAGFVWKMICQECKDKEDKALSNHLAELTMRFSGIAGEAQRTKETWQQRCGEPWDGLD